MASLSEVLIKCGRKALTTGNTEVHRGLRDLIRAPSGYAGISTVEKYDSGDPFLELTRRRRTIVWERAYECAIGCGGGACRDHCGLGANGLGSGSGPSCSACAEASGILLGANLGNRNYAVGAGSSEGLMAEICRNSAGGSAGSGVGDNLWPKCAGIRRGNFYLWVDLLVVSSG